MNGDITSMAYSIQSSKGIYALLLGSGISRNAGIPTGWEITIDLIQQISVLKTGETVNNPEKWYVETYGKNPDYSEILELLAKTSAERSQLLRQYFEPSIENDELKIKEPTVAHEIIAGLIKKGFIKVIITTNFDKLLERALERVGVTPNVISTTDQLIGALPLVHSDCTIIKVHGDYTDTRIKNTTKELNEYDEKMNLYLDRIFDDYGLIVCGWSGEWDLALRACLERCKSHRFTTYWLYRGAISDKTQSLIQHMKAISIQINDADSFLSLLNEKIFALDEMKTSDNPLTTELACITLKKFLPDIKNIIRINDMILDEAKKLREKLYSYDWEIKPTNELGTVEK